MGPDTGVESLTSAVTSGALAKHRTVGGSEIPQVMGAFPYHQLCFPVWPRLHYFFIPEIRDHLSIQSMGEEPLFHYLWIILAIAFVGSMFLKTVS